MDDRLLIKTGALVDVEQARVRENWEVLVDRGRVAYVGPDAAAGDDVPVVDLSRYTVLPGLIDCHVHLIGDTWGGRSPIEVSEADETLLGARNAQATLMAGFTSVRDVGSVRAFTNIALRRAVDEGIVPGPRMVAAGAFLTRDGGPGQVTPLASDLQVPEAYRLGLANSAGDVAKCVRRIVAGGSDFVKLMATGGVLGGGYDPFVPLFTEAEIAAAVEEAAKYDSYVVAHAYGDEGIRRAVRAGVRSIEHGTDVSDETLAAMLEHGTFLVPDLYCGEYIDMAGDGKLSADGRRINRIVTEAQRMGFRQAAEAGVPIAFGTDAGVIPHGTNAAQFSVMAREGMPPIEVIRSATVTAAKLLRRDAEVGSLSEGKRADLLAVEGDLSATLDLQRHLKLVMQGGVVVRDDRETRSSSE